MDVPLYYLWPRLRELRHEIEAGRNATATRDELLRAAYATGQFTLESLATQAGVTKQRLSQIVNR